MLKSKFADTAPETVDDPDDDAHNAHITDGVRTDGPHNEHTENGTEYVKPTLNEADANVASVHAAVADDTGLAANRALAAVYHGRCMWL